VESPFQSRYVSETLGIGLLNNYLCRVAYAFGLGALSEKIEQFSCQYIKEGFPYRKNKWGLKILLVIRQIFSKRSNTQLSNFSDDELYLAYFIVFLSKIWLLSRGKNVIMQACPSWISQV
jgi:hypothetical protein